MPDLLLELRSEEIPARMQAAGAESLRREVEKRLQAQGLDWGKAEAFATPRRLALIVRGLPAGVLASQEEVRGPRVGATYEAVEGFLRSTGVARDALEQRGEGTKAAWFATREIPARTLDEVLAEILPEAVRAVRWPKSMRWGRGNFRWVRPLRGILCILSDSARSRPVALDIEGIPCGAVTRGHPYLAPDEFTIKSVDSYESQLEDAKVILRAEDRRKCIQEGVVAAAATEGLAPILDPDLVEEIAGLVEWPVVFAGRIEEAFSDLPSELLHMSMRKHQKFISLWDNANKRVAGFVAVTDIKAADGGTQIQSGYERVLRARLADARFFWKSDLRTGIKKMRNELSGMVFHTALGSMKERAVRISRLAGEITSEIDGYPSKMMRGVGEIAKADLCSETVHEFPELQGIVGALLAEKVGEDPRICEAVRWQYRPFHLDSTGPPHRPAALVLADRADMLWGFFAAGERPTGSRDPYALRRAALAILRTLIEKDVYFSLHDLISLAEKQYQKMPLSARKKMSLPARDDACDAVVKFMLERLRVYLREDRPRGGYHHDLVTAAARQGKEDDPRWFTRLALHLDQWFRPGLREPAKDDLLAAYRRVASILDAEGDGKAQELDRELCRKPEEHSLVEALDLAKKEIEDNRSRHDPQAVLEAVAKLRGPVHRFFENVYVNDPDPKLRLNRLHLLARVRYVMGLVADFGAIED